MCTTCDEQPRQIALTKGSKDPPSAGGDGLRCPRVPPQPSSDRISRHRNRRSGRSGDDRRRRVPLTVDTRWGAGSLGEPGPAELLAAALAACLLKNLARCRDLLDFDYDEAHVEVVARRQDRPPRFVDIGYTVRVTTGETERRVELAHHNLRTFGTVYNTLAAVCDVHGSMVACAPSEASAR